MSADTKKPLPIGLAPPTARKVSTGSPDMHQQLGASRTESAIGGLLTVSSPQLVAQSGVKSNEDSGLSSRLDSRGHCSPFWPTEVLHVTLGASVGKRAASQSPDNTPERKVRLGSSLAFTHSPYAEHRDQLQPTTFRRSGCSPDIAQPANVVEFTRSVEESHTVAADSSLHLPPPVEGEGYSYPKSAFHLSLIHI